MTARLNGTVVLAALVDSGKRTKWVRLVQETMIYAAGNAPELCHYFTYTEDLLSVSRTAEKDPDLDESCT